MKKPTKRQIEASKKVNRFRVAETVRNIKKAPMMWVRRNGDLFYTMNSLMSLCGNAGDIYMDDSFPRRYTPYGKTLMCEGLTINNCAYDIKFMDAPIDLQWLDRVCATALEALDS